MDDLHKHFLAPAGQRGEDPRGKIPGGVDCIATVEPKRGPDSPEEEANRHRLDSLLQSRVVGISDCKYSQE